MLSLFFILFGFSTIHSQVYFTVLIENDVQLTFEVVDLHKSCQDWGYHYGMIANVTSKSLSGKPYSITFNGYFYATLQTKNGNSYGGKFTVTNTSPNLENLLFFNNGIQYTYPGSSKEKADKSVWCENINLYDVGLHQLEIEYWGTYGGKAIVDASPLPIELKNFSAQEQNDAVQLEWTTSSERNNAYFTLERSKDLVRFEEIARIAGQTNSVIETNYQFIDETVENGVYYYRLSQTDFDGTSKSFEPVSVEITGGNKANQFAIYPNPAVNGNFSIDFKRGFSGEVIISNVEGQTIYHQMIDNMHVLPIHFDGDKGIYFVQVIGANQQKVYVDKVLN